MKEATKILAAIVICFILGFMAPAMAQNTTTGGTGTQNTQRVDDDNDGFDWGLLGLLGLGGLAGLNKKDNRRTVHTKTDTQNR